MYNTITTKIAGEGSNRKIIDSSGEAVDFSNALHA